MYGIQWSDVQVEILRELWADPDMSASAIAKKIGGVSRNAVIGKAHRIGLPKRQPVKRAAPAKVQVEKPVPVQKVSVPPRIVVPPPLHRDDGAPVTILSVRECECRFPVGPVPSGGEMQVCGHAVARGAYCAAHAAIAFVPAKEKRKLDRDLGITRRRGWA